MSQTYLPLQTGTIYGPVNSRRLGQSLGINLLPTDRKVCSFNCVYCQYGPTRPDGLRAVPKSDPGFPSVDEVERDLRMALAQHSTVNYITFSGNGEACLHPEFPAMVDMVRGVRDDLGLQAMTAILTNSSSVDLRETRDALLRIESPFLKLDAGSDTLFRKINRPHPDVSFDRIVEEMISFDHPNLMMQAILFDGQPNNIADDNIEHWAEIIGRIRPREVQIYSIDRPVTKTGILPVSEPVLNKIAEKAQRISGVPIKVF